MGTRLDVLLLDADRAKLDVLWRDVEVELRRLEKMLNRFDGESETAKVNSDAQFASVRLSDELWSILLDCRRYYELTNGCFDVTLSDFGKIIFMEESQSILFDKYGLSLDFGGYAKGYALRRVRKYIEEAAVKQAMVNFGNSSALAVGSHPFGESWKISVEDPFTGMMAATISLKDESLSVSGNSPSNKRHIVNTATSEFVEGDRMVAIVSDDPVDAEAITTAWIASGEDGEPAWLSNFKLKTYKIR
jgi:thiamine biosynthesis lipoprotein